MTEHITQNEINNIVWRACDTFRGAVDPSEYKNYILTMLFIKYLSDLWKDKHEEYEKKYHGDKQRIERILSRERFIIPVVELRDSKTNKVTESFFASFDNLYERRDRGNIGELINIVLERIEDANKTKLENVFRNIDFNSEANLGQTKERNRRLKNLLEDFNNPKPGERICDPTTGSGSLLIRVAKEVPDHNFFLAGQESNGSTWSLCRMNMFLHELDNARIEWCDTITNPKLIEGDSLMKFNVVVANPPFSLDKWGAEHAENDRFRRFWRGIPPKSKGDYAFICHMIEIALEGEGKIGVIVPHGVLFRGGSEGIIRRKLVEENLLEAVIGLPPNLFFGTTIPAAILLFNKGKKTKDVLFIDASREFLDGKNQNYLRPEGIEKIVKTYKAFKPIEKYAYRATFEEIQ